MRGHVYSSPPAADIVLTVLADALHKRRPNVAPLTSHPRNMSSDYSAAAQAIRESQARRNSNSSTNMKAPIFGSTASAADVNDRRRQSWDWAETRAPSYPTKPSPASTSATAAAPAATTTPSTAAPATQQAPQTTLPGPAGRRPSWVERHLSLGEEDTRRAFGL